MKENSARRGQLLQRVKYGRQTGTAQWARFLVMLGAAAVMFDVVLDVHRGRGSFILLADAVVMVFIAAVAALGLSLLEMNERFAALLELLGEDANGVTQPR